jgi:hypothetical protein
MRNAYKILVKKYKGRVADGGNSLQIWRVDTNILNKQSRTADKGWSFSVGLPTPQRKKLSRYENSQEIYGKVQLTRARHNKWEVDIKMDVKVVGWEVLDWR